MGAARGLLSLWKTQSLLVTLGEQGMLLFQGDGEPLHLPARAQEVFDVSGAGDTAIAVFTLSLTAGATPAEAAELANRASGIVVGKVGTATVTPAELMAACAAG
jgi:D-beta-D-heptose 7-phosphate kinase/D-beta-D-heptose 1-phosphate adenosyltransferase